MPNVQRPAKKPDGTIGAIKVAGKIYVVRFQELTGTDAAALRSSTGMTLQQLAEKMQAEPDIDLVAAMVWLARRQQGERDLAYADVADSITYGSDIQEVKPDELALEHDAPQP